MIGAKPSQRFLIESIGVDTLRNVGGDTANRDHRKPSLAYWRAVLLSL
jgi:hypothetical protein